MFIKNNKWADPVSGPIFKRRFLLILTHWVEILPKPISRVLWGLLRLCSPAKMKCLP